MFWLLEYLLALFGLLLCSGALVWLHTGVDQRTPLGEPNPMFLVISGGVYLMALILLLPRWREVALVLAKNKSLLLLLTVAATSFLWAVDPAVALRRALALLLTFGFAVWLALRFAPRTLFGFIIAALLLVAIASLTTAFLIPEVGRHIGDSHAGLWRGVFGHKNIMGRMMSFAVIAGVLLLLTNSGLRLQAVGAVALGTPLVMMSGSATAGATTLFVLLILPACNWLSRSGLPPRVVVPGALGVGLLLALTIMIVADPILALLGRDPTLSGRTRLWELALNEGLSRPLLGAGFRTFWLEKGPGGTVMALVSWGDGNIGNGHNAYLDLWLELGLVGIAAYVVLLKEIAMRIADLIRQRDPLGVWLAVGLVHLSVYAMTERVLLEHSDLGWLLLMVLLLQATPALAPARKALA